MQIPAVLVCSYAPVLKWFGDYRGLRFLCGYFGSRTFYFLSPLVEGGRTGLNMTELVDNLIMTGSWLAAVICFGVGVMLCIGNLITGGRWAKCCAVLGVVLGAAAFAGAYSWTGHIPWCLMIAGIVTGLVSNITGR